ncbi:hypothetical protein ABZ820_36050 [Streptomyces diacarni]|uniref:hypothetical protein n=1 Tax=Streptomyces diacarni TaxID=2800381 RepID=UPI0033DA398E
MTHTSPGDLGPAVEDSWSPPSHAPFTLTPVGVWWDAVRVPWGRGSRAIQRLGRACGGVVGDPYGAWLYWLVPPRAGVEWGSAGEAVCLSVACWLPVPARDRTGPPGPYWAVPYEAGSALTDAARLRAALRGER